MSAIQKHKKAIIISAHADDHIMAAGTLAKLHSQGYELFEILLTNSAEGRDFRDMTNDNVVDLRRKEYRNASAALGISQTFEFALEDLSITYSKEVMFEMVVVIRSVQPAVVFMHHEFDWHPDHKSASQLSKETLKIAGTNIRPDLGASWRVPVTLQMEGMVPIVPDVLVDITEFAHVKRDIWAHYGSQASPELIAYSEGLMSVRGYQLKADAIRFAEAFTTDSVAPLVLFHDLE